MAKIRHPSTGQPIEVTNLPDGGGVVAHVEGPVVPDAWLGFALRQFVSPRKRAFFTEFLPIEDDAKALCRKLGQRKVLVTTPLTREGVEMMKTAQNSEEAVAIAEESFQAGKALVLSYFEEWADGKA